MTPYFQYLTNGTFPDNAQEAKKLCGKALLYTMIEGKLYCRGNSTPLLRCFKPSKAEYALAEIHEGVCGQHPSSKSLTKKVLSVEGKLLLAHPRSRHNKTCQKMWKVSAICIHVAPLAKLKTLASLWPFTLWGTDISGPFSGSPRTTLILSHCHWLFYKMDRGRSRHQITGQNFSRFVHWHIFSRFDILNTIVNNNETHFTDKRFQDCLGDFEIKQHFTSVEQPQTNGQAEVANRVILRGLKMILDLAKGIDQLHNVLWASQTTSNSTIGETPFRLTYGTKLVILVEMGESSLRKMLFDISNNEMLIRGDLDLLKEKKKKKEVAAIREAAIKQKTAAINRHMPSIVVWDLI